MMAGASSMLGGLREKEKGKEEKKLGVGLAFTFCGVDWVVMIIQLWIYFMLYGL